MFCANNKVASLPNNVFTCKILDYEPVYRLTSIILELINQQDVLPLQWFSVSIVHYTPHGRACRVLTVSFQTSGAKGTARSLYCARACQIRTVSPAPGTASRKCSCAWLIFLSHQMNQKTVIHYFLRLNTEKVCFVFLNMLKLKQMCFSL